MKSHTLNPMVPEVIDPQEHLQKLKNIAGSTQSQGYDTWGHPCVGVHRLTGM